MQGGGSWSRPPDMEKDKNRRIGGMDDYVTKPFSTQELLARIRAGLRRSPLAPEAAPQPLQIDSLEIDFTARRVVAAGREVRLTRTEFDLLQYLATNPNTAIPHRRLLQAAWGPDYGNDVVYLRVFISRLHEFPAPFRSAHVHRIATESAYRVAAGWPRGGAGIRTE
jgi:two-component system, OmpR family, KDP operon response regulator KdpE